MHIKNSGGGTKVMYVGVGRAWKAINSKKVNNDKYKKQDLFFRAEETQPIGTWKNAFPTIKTYNLSLTSHHI